jgi:diaminohydroxyphosphoribosylaminopyrimidine deaminase/5-amino-6-(5-phosphoribosylamino)uracil reductase
MLASQLNWPYLTLLEEGRPYIHAKWAMSLDGKIATASGDSKWISCPESRKFVHQLRGRMDGILVGAGTVRTDDPLLTARPSGPRVATRIVLSRSGALPPGCQLLRTAREAPVLVVTLPGRGAELRGVGCEVLEVEEEGGRPSVRALVKELGRRRMTNLLVEGGAEVLGSLCDQRLIDELHVFVAPRLMGGRDARSPVGGTGASEMQRVWPLFRWHHEWSGQDVYLHGWPVPMHPPRESE